MRRPALVLAAAALGLFATAACGDDEIQLTCDDGGPVFFDSGKCGRDGEDGSCASIGCAASGGMLACGCDGKVYDNFCDAYEAGFDLDDEGKCEVPPDRFACGPLMCLRGTEYCEEADFGDRPEFACRTIPEACMPAACDCLDLFPAANYDCSARDGELFVVESVFD